MSGFENYEREFDNLDQQIQHYATLCQIDLANRAMLEICLHEQHARWSEDKARATLRGLLILRIKLETEMIEQGMEPPHPHLNTISRPR
jgi:hypothetical protein